VQFVVGDFYENLLINNKFGKTEQKYRSLYISIQVNFMWLAATLNVAQLNITHCCVPNATLSILYCCQRRAYVSNTREGSYRFSTITIVTRTRRIKLIVPFLSCLIFQLGGT